MCLGGFQPRVCAVLFRDSKQNQIHQPARPYNVGGWDHPPFGGSPPDLSPHAQVPDASKHRGVDCPTLGVTGVHVKGVAPRSRPPVPGLSGAPGLRPPTPRGPSVAPGPRPPVLGHTTWRGVPRAGRGAYNLAWHALSRPTPFSFATVNKTKFTRPPGHTMWGGWDHPPFGAPPPTHHPMLKSRMHRSTGG